MKITIVITYFERFFQLCKTLESIRAYSDVDIIIIDDGSEIPLSTEATGKGVTVQRMADKDWTLQVIAMNRGLEMAFKNKSDAVIIQGAECMHIGKVVDYVKEHLTDKNYLSFSCYSIGEKETFQDWNRKTLDRAAENNGENGWYNHITYRPCAYDWCAALTVKNWKRLNGYDERYAYGIGMGDEDLIQRIKLLGLKKKIVPYPYVVHQWHYNGNYLDPHKNQAKYKKNQILLKKINGYRAKHIKTPNWES